MNTVRKPEHRYLNLYMPVACMLPAPALSMTAFPIIEPPGYQDGDYLSLVFGYFTWGIAVAAALIGLLATGCLIWHARSCILKVRRGEISREMAQRRMIGGVFMFLFVSVLLFLASWTVARGL